MPKIAPEINFVKSYQVVKRFVEGWWGFLYLLSMPSVVIVRGEAGWWWDLAGNWVNEFVNSTPVAAVKRIFDDSEY